MFDDVSVRESPSAAAAAQPAGSVEAATALPLHDPEALGRLLLALEPRLHSVATRITRNPETARDVVQSAFEKVLLHGGRFEGQARVSTWLHRIVSNEALMWLRAQRRRGEAPAGDEARRLESVADPAADPARHTQRRQEARHLHAGLRQLPAEERDVLVRCGLLEDSYAEYAARTGLHPGAVKTRAFRGRRKLHALLAGV